MGGAQEDWAATAEALRTDLVRHLNELTALDTDELLERRWKKFEAMGRWRELDIVP